MDKATEATSECVRFVLFHSNAKTLIKAKSLKDIVKKYNIKLSSIMKNLNQVLLKIYGYKLVALDDSAKFILINVTKSLDQENVAEENGNVDDDDEDVPKDAYKVLILLVLTHIFMSEDKVSEANLEKFLNIFNIRFEERHDIYGNVKVFITNTMIAEYYLNKVVDGNMTFYLWGPRSEAEISKKEILDFASEVYGKQSSNFERQLKEANEQYAEASEEE